MVIHFIQPETKTESSQHHTSAAAGNSAVAAEAAGVLLDAISADNPFERILIRAAAGAGKSYVLKKLVVDAIADSLVNRVAVVAFQNRQLYPLAESLGRSLGKEVVCLLSSKDAAMKIPLETSKFVSIALSPSEIPESATVIISTVHKLYFTKVASLVNTLGPAVNGDSAFDVLFVDEAWQVPHHLFDGIANHAPIHVGVGDVGQLPPLEVGDNPWRGDPGFNPYRAWPTAYENAKDEGTWVAELPAVWRPHAAQLELWRAFYPNWEELNCVAAFGDRRIKLGGDLKGDEKVIWEQISSGIPTILEVDGLKDADTPDVDLPLMQFAETLISKLFKAGFSLHSAEFDDFGSPNGKMMERKVSESSPDPLIALLATRNQAVDDATDAVERISKTFSLTSSDLIASTVDSWQGQTNGITVAIHPLSGASALDEFNSAFGRLAVTCTRATHGLLMLTRPGLDDLLREAPARPGTPFGEPGFRTLPRQTHQRILASFARGRLTLNNK